MYYIPGDEARHLGHTGCYGAGKAHGESPEAHRQQAQPLLAALRNAGMPLLIDENRAYFIGTDERGVRFEIILVADDRDADLWTAIHALPTRYRKNW
jgi:hypothetical protein